MKTRFIISCVALASTCAIAQTPISPAAAPTGIGAEKITPSQQKELAGIPFGKAVEGLKNLSIDDDKPVIVVQNQGSRTVAPERAAPAPTVASQVAPSQFVQREFPLDATGSSAVKRARAWMARHNQSADGNDGRVEYTFGSGMPQVVCAPLHICIVELQAGERIISEPQIGDSVRWHVTPSAYGEGDARTELVVIKPSEVGLDTNLVLSTNRRVYYMRLVSRNRDYTPRIAFAYPQDAQREWEAHIAREKSREANTITTASLSVDDLNFAYEVQAETRGSSYMIPVRVFDDGSKTYIQMPAAMDKRETPALMHKGLDGNLEMLNYRVKGNTYVVDRLIDTAVLVLGVGKTQRRVFITAKGAEQASSNWFGGNGVPTNAGSRWNNINFDTDYPFSGEGPYVN
jgi:type IV secretion system protein VirB9